MELIWHGHSCFELRGSRSLAFDPHDGRSIGIPPPNVSAELLFITHEHFDHNAVRSIRGEPRVIDHVYEGDLDGVTVRTYVLPHDNASGKRRGMVRGFHVEMDGITFLFLGDVGDLPPPKLVEREKEVAVLFIPVGGVFTIGPEQAVEWIAQLQPTVSVPMHYRVGGISLSIKPVDEFLSLIDRKVLKVGNVVSFQPEDLTGEPLVWVFSL